MYTRKIHHIVQQHKSIFHIDTIRSLTTKKLGTGENNLNILVTVNEKKFVFRLARHENDGNALQREFVNLDLLPANMGPTPLYLDTSKSIIPYAFSVLSYVEGDNAETWSPRHLMRHAQKLGLLHKKRYLYYGDSSEKKTAYDLHAQLQSLLGEYAVFTVQDQYLKTVLSNVNIYFQANNHLFLSLKQFSLLHGDLYVDNILFHGDDIYYIDWEMMTIGDNAEDLARFFQTDFSFVPWYIQLGENELQLFLDAYLEQIDDPTLKERVTVLNVYFQCADLLYFKCKLENFSKGANVFPKHHYEACTEALTQSLARRFL